METLNTNQLNDIFVFLVRICKEKKGIINSSSIPKNAEQIVVDEGLFDSLKVWFLDGWPIAASDEMSALHWSIKDRLS